MGRRFIYLFIIVLTFSILNFGCSDNPVEPNSTRLLVSDIPSSFTAPFGGPSPNQLSFYITSSSEQVLNYKISKKASWIQIFNSDRTLFGITPDTIFISIRVSVPQSLGHGTYYDTISITTDSVRQDIILKEIILNIGTEISTTPLFFEYFVNVNGVNPASQTLEINSTSSLQFDVALSHASSWLLVPIDSYYTDDTDKISISINTFGLPKGDYFDTIWISSDTALNSPYSVIVKAYVKPWLPQESPWKNNINDVYFANALNGWAVGDIIGANANSGFIIKTDDGGDNWETVRFLPGQSSSDSILAGVKFVNNDGWAVGSNGIIMGSNDLGDNWTSQTPPNNLVVDFNDIFFVSSDSGWIVGDSGIILATTDGGINWQVQGVPRNQENDSLNQVLTGISFIDNMRGWVSGLTDIILVTSDGGQTWEQQVVPPQTPGVGDKYDFKEIAFIDNLHGWSIGKLGLLILTNDGGVTWNYQQLPQTVGLLSVYFSDVSNGWISGQNGIIFHTVDGGQNWTEQTIETTSSLQSIHFIDQNNGWVVGGDGTIMHSTSGGE